jgi:hypothetical protein
VCTTLLGRDYSTITGVDMAICASLFVSTVIKMNEVVLCKLLHYTLDKMLNTIEYA